MKKEEAMDDGEGVKKQNMIERIRGKILQENIPAKDASEASMRDSIGLVTAQ